MEKTLLAAGVAIIICGQARAQYLSANPFEEDSTSNPFSEVGSPFGLNSINNPFSPQGSPFSLVSANNPFGQGVPIDVTDPTDKLLGLDDKSLGLTTPTAGWEEIAAESAKSRRETEAFWAKHQEAFEKEVDALSSGQLKDPFEIKSSTR